MYSPAEKRLFWIGLVANVVAWGGLAVLEVFRLKFGELEHTLWGLFSLANLSRRHCCLGRAACPST